MNPPPPKKAYMQKTFEPLLLRKPARLPNLLHMHRKDTRPPKTPPSTDHVLVRQTCLADSAPKRLLQLDVPRLGSI